MSLQVFFRKINSMLKIMRSRSWGLFWDKFPFAKKLISITNYVPHRDKYHYILLGGHGLGYVAVMFYLKKIEAKPLDILSYEIVRPFVFFRNFYGLTMDKAPLNDDAKAILQKCKKKVPLYQIIRDPISTIKSNINVQIFHAISSVNSKQDVQSMLLHVVKEIPHLIFYYTSMRNLVAHITSDVTYLRIRDIDDSGMHSTIATIANRFGYNPTFKDSEGGGAKESAIKGSIFPRCFPYSFCLEVSYLDPVHPNFLLDVSRIDFSKTPFKKYEIFAISTKSRLDSKREAEMDSTKLNKPHKLPYPYYIIDIIIVQNYEAYPLLLVSSAPKDPKKDYTKAKQKALDYIEYAISNIKKHESLTFNEQDIIDTLLANKKVAEELAQKIRYELSVLVDDMPGILDEFQFTKQFLVHFGLENINSAQHQRKEAR